MFSRLTSFQKQILSIAFTLLVYTWILSWKAAIIVVIGVGFHELCHLWAAKKLKLSTGGFYIMPFVGGVAFVTERYKRYSQQAFVVLAGPAGAGLLALLTTVAFYLTGYAFLGVAAVFMIWMNLFNLLPLSFLDGGQLLETVTYSINEKLGVICKVISTLIAVFVIWHLNPFITGFIVLFGGYDCYNEVKAYLNKKEGKTYLIPDRYLNRPEAMSLKDIQLTIGCQLITIGMLLLAVNWINHMTDSVSSLLLNGLK